MLKKNIKKNTGFTLIEMMVSVSIFIILLTFGMSALLNAVNINKKSQGMRSIFDNLNFVMDEMSRNLRVGLNYYCSPNIDDTGYTVTNYIPQRCDNGVLGSGGRLISFNAADNTPLNPDQLTYIIDRSGAIKKKVNSESFISLTDPRITIDPYSSSFEVRMSEIEQPFVIIRLNGIINYNNTKTPFNIQTSISQRYIQ